jgi:ADP-heptose:LPS heptosyltransferase
MKILIIRFSSIGDIVLTTPVVRCLHQQLGAEVHFLTKRSFKTVLEANPYISKLWLIDKKVSEQIVYLKAERFDAVVDLHNNLRSAQVKWALSTKNFVFHKLNVEKWLMVKAKINILPPVHIVERYLKTVERLGVKNDGRGLDYFIPPKDEVTLSELLPRALMLPEKRKTDRLSLRSPVDSIIALVIGAAHATKRLPIEQLIALCDKLPLPILLLGGKEDSERGQIIENQSIGKVVNLCGKLNLNQSASVVRQAKLVITHDTGLMHIAAAFQQSIISIWGNTIPAFGMTPYLPKNLGGAVQVVKDSQGQSIIFEIENLACRPCSKIGYDSCPKGHFKCMTTQNTEGVVAAANRIVGMEKREE